ncbi:autotransporter assembly complex protein TamA [Thiolapillus sp.]|uniref:autotransporter assembly complex protein TamA n=1 Tax=Thiolapillus sp. TaxID=2017437 RepID=UPI003AF5AA80
MGKTLHFDRFGRSFGLGVLLLCQPFFLEQALADEQMPAAAAEAPADNKSASAKATDKEEADKTDAEAVPGKVQLEVDIQGLEGDMLKNAQAYLRLLQKKDDPHLTELWVKHLHHKAVDEIQKSLQPFGYYNVQVKASLEKQADGKWVARYMVDPGPRVKISKVDLQWSGEGAEEPALQAAANAFPVKAGDFLDDEVYDKAKGRLLELANSLGYPDAEAKVARVLVDPVKNSAAITLHLDTGHKYYISDIRLHQDFLDPGFVQRYLVDVKPGDTYSQANLQEIQKDLVKAGYFSLVDIHPRFKQASEYRVPVDVNLEPAKRQMYSFGMGYDTDIGLNLSANWAHRRINKYGHKADARLKLSIVQLLLQGNYWIPIRDPRTTKLGFSVRLESEILDDSERDTLDLEAGYYLLWHEWITELYTELKYEQFTVGLSPSTESIFFSIGATAERSFFEEGNYPRWAWGVWVDLRGSPGLISSTDYIRTHVKGRVYLPVFTEGRLILRGEVGLARVGDYDKYPNSLRFYAGGDNSVRGYDWKSLGSKDEKNNVIGGKQVLTASLEYDHRVAEQWLAAGFVDAGNAFNDNLDHVFVGAGFGARWLSPVGTLWLDFAWPVHKENDSTSLSDIKVHFGFEVLL